MCVNNVGAAYTCTCNSGYEDDGTGLACVGKIHQVELLLKFPIGKIMKNKC